MCHLKVRPMIMMEDREDKYTIKHKESSKMNERRMTGHQVTRGNYPLQ